MPEKGLSEISRPMRELFEKGRRVADDAAELFERGRKLVKD